MRLSNLIKAKQRNNNGIKMSEIFCTKVNKHFYEASRGAAARNVTKNRLVVGSIPTRGDEIFT